MLRNKGREGKTLLTLYGTIQYQRTFLIPKSAESRQILVNMEHRRGIFPLDSFLCVDCLPFKITVKMMTAISKEATRASSYQRAADVINEHYGVCINKDTVRCVTDFVGEAVFKDDSRRAEEAKASLEKSFDKRKRHRKPDDVLYIEMDGAMLNTRIEKEGSSWMECKIGLVFHSSDLKSWMTKQGQIRREITKKRLVGYIGNCQTFKYHILALAELYDYRCCTKIVVISDGAEWIHRLVKEIFPDATHILDLSHVKERISAFGKWLKGDCAEALDWIKSISEKVEQGEIDAVLDELEPYKDTKCPENVLNLYTYISNHKSCMNYKDYKDKGYFVGSGASESANKYTMQNRMKLQGMRWNVATGQGMLSLKARLESNCWDEVDPILRNSLYDNA